MKGYYQRNVHSKEKLLLRYGFLTINGQVSSPEKSSSKNLGKFQAHCSTFNRADLKSITCIGVFFLQSIIKWRDHILWEVRLPKTICRWEQNNRSKIMEIIWVATDKEGLEQIVGSVSGANCINCQRLRRLCEHGYYSVWDTDQSAWQKSHDQQ